MASARSRAAAALLLVANVINLGADLGAMGAALGLLIGGPEHLYTVLFGVVCVLLGATGGGKGTGTAYPSNRQ
jgi:hypothetical protein